MSILILGSESHELKKLADCLASQTEQSILVFSEYNALDDYCTKSGDLVACLVASLSLMPSRPGLLPKIPKVIITEGMPVLGNDLLRWSNVMDFVQNTQSHNHSYIVTLVRRALRQGPVTALVAHGDQHVRNLLNNLLLKQGMQVFQASSFSQAKSQLAEHTDIKLVICSMEISGGTHGALLMHIREHRSKQDLSIIGVTDTQETGEVVSLLRQGANDVILMPISLAELHARVAQSLALTDAFQEISELSNKDFLTGLFNRRHFYEAAEKLFAQMRRGKIRLAVAMLDIDNFKRVNDTLGHAAGDLAIQEVARQLKLNVRETDVVARFGGEEFCVLLAGHVEEEHALQVFERLVQRIAQQQMVLGNHTFTVTVSCGLALHPEENLDAMIQESDRLLYQAKTTGKNKVVVRQEVT